LAGRTGPARGFQIDEAFEGLRFDTAVCTSPFAAAVIVRYNGIVNPVGSLEKGGHACLSAEKVLADLLAGELERL